MTLAIPEDTYRLILKDPKVRIMVHGVQLWPQKSSASLPIEASKTKGLLTEAPAEVLCRIADFLDDVGFVCLRNSHPRLRTVLTIDSLSITPVEKYVIRGLMGLHGIADPAASFCERRTLNSDYWKYYPDTKPGIVGVEQWRARNIMRSMRPIIVRREGHFCNVGQVTVSTDT